MSDPRGYIDFAAVKAAVPLEKVLIHYGVFDLLKPYGTGLRSCCPIHKGDNPKEFSVALERNLWNCFSLCKGGGNMLEFVIQMENCSLNEAAWKVNDWFDLGHEKKSRQRNRTPANRHAKPKQSEEPAKADPAAKAVQIEPLAACSSAPATPKPSTSKKAPAKETGENTVLDFALTNLDGTHPYLRERGLTAETIAHFGVGYCPGGIMRGRIAIPIHNAAGQIVANAGRWPGEPPEGKEKYLLPSKFLKSLEVFNLHRAAVESADAPLVIVEGFFPVMHLWQHGIRRVVALMGSHISERQEERIAGIITPRCRILLMLDNDGAGIIAAEKIVPRLAAHGYVKIFQWPEGVTQPDSLTAEQLSGIQSLA